MSPTEVKSRATEVITAAKNELNATKTEWERIKNAKEVDPDTAEKTDNQLIFLQKKIDNISTAIEKPPYQGDAYTVYLLRMLIDKRIKSSQDT